MPITYVNLEPKTSNKNSEYRRRMQQFIGEDEFKRAYADDEKILEMIFTHRILKTDGLCPCCHRELKNYKKIPGKPAYRCACGNRVYPLKGTPLERVHKRLSLIFWLIYNIFANRQGLSVRQVVSRKLIVNYGHAAKIMRNISDWMALCIIQEPFPDGSTIQVDETKVAVYEPGVKRSLEAKKHLVVYTLVEEKTGLTKVYVGGEDANSEDARVIFQKNFNDTHQIYTDESAIYRPLRTDYNMAWVNHSKKEYARKSIIDALQGARIVTTNKNESFNRKIKVAVHRIHNSVSPHHLSGYVHRVAFNNTYSMYNINQVIDRLIDSLPPLFVDGTQRKGLVPYVAPNWKWKKAA